MESLVWMYHAHAAIEYTVVFPAWEKTLTAEQPPGITEKFESIQRQQFGGDGLEDALGQIGRIEAKLGLADLTGLTAPPPPSV
jgi:hypothetical protein